MLKWILLAAEVALAGIGLYSYWKNRKTFHKIFFMKAVALSVGVEAARRIPSVRIMPQDLRHRIHILHPEQSEKESCKEYIRQKAVQIYILLLVANTLLLAAALQITEGQDIGYSLQRPAYGYRDRTETLIAKGNIEEAEVRISIPSQNATSEQAESVLQAAEGKLREELDAMGAVRKDLYLPIHVGDVEITYTRFTDNDIASVGEDGYLRISETETEPIELKAELFYQGFNRICTLEIAIAEEESPTFASTVREAAEAAEMTSSEIILPSEVTVDGSVEQVVWQTPDGSREILRYAAFFWLLPILLLALDRIELKRKERERTGQITMRFPFLVERLIVYLGAGLSLMEAWNRIAAGSHKDPLTEEVEVTRLQIRNGMPLQEALWEFGNRIPNADVRKLSGMLARNLRRGDEYLLDRLTELNQDAWESYRKEVRIRSEEAETRMLLPMILLLIVVLMLVMAPAMLTFRG